MSWRDALSALGYETQSRALEEPVEPARPIKPQVITPVGRPGNAGVPGARGPLGGYAQPFTSASQNLGTAYSQRASSGLGKIGAWDPSQQTLAEGPYGRGWYSGLGVKLQEERTKADEALAAEAGNPPPVGQTSSPATGGGGWAVQDAWNAGYASASKTTGVPANWIKAIQRIETGGADLTGVEPNCAVPGHGDDCLALNAGIFAETAASWGLDFERIQRDPEYAILAVATTMQKLAMSDAGEWGGTPGKTLLDDGGWEGVARTYHGGRDGYTNPAWEDSNGVSSGEYAATVVNYVNQLEERGANPGTGGQSVSSPSQPASGQVGNYNGKAIADLADEYVNVPYYLGKIPTEDQDPYATGWDCSGFTRWIFDKLGYADNDIAGGLPAGSHPQAQWAIDNDRWRDGIDLKQMQPGDLIFMDTGVDGGGYQNEVSAKASRATHVGIYLGDGKMINAMHECGTMPGDVMGVSCGTGIVSMDDGYWGGTVIGWADTSDIMGSAVAESPPKRTSQETTPAPAPVSTPGTAVSTPAGGTLPRQDETAWGSTGSVR